MTTQVLIVAIEIDDETGRITNLSQIGSDGEGLVNHNIEFPDITFGDSRAWRITEDKGIGISVMEEEFDD